MTTEELIQKIRTVNNQLVEEYERSIEISNQIIQLEKEKQVSYKKSIDICNSI